MLPFPNQLGFLSLTLVKENSRYRGEGCHRFVIIMPENRTLPPYLSHLFALAILLTHYAFLVPIQNLTVDYTVRSEVLFLLGLQCLLCMTILFGSANRFLAGWAPVLLAILFIANQWVWGLPYSNHHTVLSVVSLSFIFCSTGVPLRRSVGAVVVVAYLFTFFYKLNLSFFDPDQSCAVLFLDNTFSSLFGTPSPHWLTSSAPLLTLIAELAIPICLLLRPLGVAALLIAVVFHGLLALDIAKHFFDFSVVMISLVAIAVIDDNTISELRDREGGRLPLKIYRSVNALTFVAILLAWSRSFGLNESISEAQLLILGTVIAMILLLTMAAVIIRNWGVFIGSKVEAFPRGFGILPALCMGIVCAGPILGFRTRFSIDMYSGLEIGGNSSNHYLLGPSIDLLGYLDDWAFVHSSDNVELQRRIDLNDNYLPFLELRRIYQQSPRTSIEFSRNGERIISTPDSPYLPLTRPLNIFEEKFIVFRPNSVIGKDKCRW